MRVLPGSYVANSACWEIVRNSSAPKSFKSGILSSCWSFSSFFLNIFTCRSFEPSENRGRRASWSRIDDSDLLPTVGIEVGRDHLRGGDGSLSGASRKPANVVASPRRIEVCA